MRVSNQLRRYRSASLTSCNVLIGIKDLEQQQLLPRLPAQEPPSMLFITKYLQRFRCVVREHTVRGDKVIGDRKAPAFTKSEGPVEGWSEKWTPSARWKKQIICGQPSNCCIVTEYEVKRRSTVMLISDERMDGGRGMAEYLIIWIRPDSRW